MNSIPTTEVAFRVGSAAAGMLAGLLLGFLSAVIAIGVLNFDPSFPTFVFGGSAIGTLIGLIFPGTARRLAEGTVHFAIGVASSPAYGDVEPNQDAPRWLKVVFWLGVLAGLLILIALWWS